MVFTKRLRDGVRKGEITCSVRIWMRPHVKVGARYPMEEGEIQVDSITPIGFPDITGDLARESGFLGVIDLLKVIIAALFELLQFFLMLKMSGYNIAVIKE